MALAQGANDVANAIGPLAVIYFLVKTGSVGAKVPVPVFLLLFGGIGIACGIAMAGYRVMETMGKKITTLSNTRGFSVEFCSGHNGPCGLKNGSCRYPQPMPQWAVSWGSALRVELKRLILALFLKLWYTGC